MWGVLVHLVIPPFVFMVTEEWNYIQGLYYSFITISTIGFGDFVAGESCPTPCPCLPSLSASLSASPAPFSRPSTFVGSPGGHLCPSHSLHPVRSSPYPASCKRQARPRVIAGDAHFPFLGRGFLLSALSL